MLVLRPASVAPLSMRRLAVRVVAVGAVVGGGGRWTAVGAVQQSPGCHEHEPSSKIPNGPAEKLRGPNKLLTNRLADLRPGCVIREAPAAVEPQQHTPAKSSQKRKRLRMAPP
jgi:hypothetical protein